MTAIQMQIVCQKYQEARRVLTRMAFQTWVQARTDEFCTKVCKPSIPVFTGNP
jgi:hypothetical protein